MGHIDKGHVIPEKDHGLTTGSIYKKMVLFALPIFLSNLFQQLYNTVDALIVGNALDEKALAAVGAGGSIIFLMTGFVYGLSVGAGVIIARFFGAKDWERLTRSIHTSIALGVIIGVVMTIVSVVCTPLMLRLLGTPEDVLPQSISYFGIYCLGTFAIVMNNFGTSVLMSVGDSRRPMIYLIISAVSNVFLDLLFILVFKMGVEGAALASVCAMVIHLVLTYIKLTRLGLAGEKWGLKWRQIRLDKNLLKPIVVQGVPSGLQNSVTSLSHLVIQSSINLFGAAAMAGCISNSRVEGFVFLPITSFAMALTTFVSQNIGAKRYDRVRQGMKFGVITSVVLSELIGVVTFIFAPVFIGMFSQEPQVVEIGTAYMRSVSLFYCLLAYSHSCSGILRGLGKPIIAMGVFLTAWCVFRIIFVVTGIRLIHDIAVIFWAYPTAWSLSSILFTIFVIRTLKRVLPKENGAESSVAF